MATEQKGALSGVSNLGNPSSTQASKKKPNMAQASKKKPLMSRWSKQKAEAVGSRRKILATLSKTAMHVEALGQLQQELSALTVGTYYSQPDASKQKAIDEVLTRKEEVICDMAKVLMEDADPRVVARIEAIRQSRPPMGYRVLTPSEVDEMMGKSPWDDILEELDL